MGGALGGNEGLSEGEILGSSVGPLDGVKLILGIELGDFEGRDDGAELIVGIELGDMEGEEDGAGLGGSEMDGTIVGSIDGSKLVLGIELGDMEGDDDGSELTLGVELGDMEGEEDGAGLGGSEIDGVPDGEPVTRAMNVSTERIFPSKTPEFASNDSCVFMFSTIKSLSSMTRVPSSSSSSS